MSDGWSLWVVILIVINLTIAFVLLIFGTRVEIPTHSDGTTGHRWAHGVLKEAVRKLPGWWYAISIFFLVFAVVYLYQYPGFGNREGSLQWTSDKEHAELVEKNNEVYSPLLKRVKENSLHDLLDVQDVRQAGKTLFQDNCSACHGMQGEGHTAVGAPALRDVVWLYGSSEEAILHSINEGRAGFMPGWQQFGYGRIKNLSHYVRSLSGLAHGSAEAKVGAIDFAENCVACHGIDGKGNQSMGAPDLTDNDWLYGSELHDIEVSIEQGRKGVMPGWKERLSAEQIKMMMVWMLAKDE